MHDSALLAIVQRCTSTHGAMSNKLCNDVPEVGRQALARCLPDGALLMHRWHIDVPVAHHGTKGAVTHHLLPMAQSMIWSDTQSPFIVHFRTGAPVVQQQCNFGIT